MTSETTKLIFRYQLAVDDFSEVVMPRGAQVLSVAPSRVPGQMLDLWAMVDPSAPLGTRKFRVIGTGNPVGPPPGRFVGTVALLGGEFVGHVFEASTS